MISDGDFLFSFHTFQLNILMSIAYSFQALYVIFSTPRLKIKEGQLKLKSFDRLVDTFTYLAHGKAEVENS